MSKFERRRTVDESAWFVARTVSEFKRTEGVRVHVCGSFRRAVEGSGETVGDIDLLVTSETPGLDMMAIDVPEWCLFSKLKAYGWLELGAERMHVDAWWTPWESVGPFMLFLTGPMTYNVWMRALTNQRREDLMLTQYGLFRAVAAPTKTYPNRRKPGERVDRQPPDDVVEFRDKEEWFWREWAREVGWDGDFPSPGVRRRG